MPLANARDSGPRLGELRDEVATAIAMASGTRTRPCAGSDLAAKRRETTRDALVRTMALRAHDRRGVPLARPPHLRAARWRRGRAAAPRFSAMPAAGDDVLSGDRRPPRDHAAGCAGSIGAWLRLATSRRGYVPAPGYRSATAASSNVASHASHVRRVVTRSLSRSAANLAACARRAMAGEWRTPARGTLAARSFASLLRADTNRSSRLGPCRPSGGSRAATRGRRSGSGRWRSRAGCGSACSATRRWPRRCCACSCAS